MANLYPAVLAWCQRHISHGDQDLTTLSIKSLISEDYEQYVSQSHVIQALDVLGFKLDRLDGNVMNYRFKAKLERLNGD